MNNTLYELTAQYKEFAELLFDEEADIESIGQACEMLAGDIKDKAENYAKIIRQLDGDAEVLEAEEKRLNRKRTALKNRSKWLKRNLQEAMETIGAKKFKTELFSFNIQKNAKQVQFTDEEEFLNWAIVNKAEFVRYPKPEINKTEVKDFLANGGELELAKLTQSESLRIR